MNAKDMSSGLQITEKTSLFFVYDVSAHAVVFVWFEKEKCFCRLINQLCTFNSKKNILTPPQRQAPPN